jgi:hypothetical protein
MGICRHYSACPQKACSDYAGDASPLTLTSNIFRLLDLSRGLLILRAVGPSMALANIFSFRLHPKVPDAYSSHR